MKSEKQSDPKELFIKKILKSEIYSEQFLKDCIRMFPFRDCTIFRQVKLFSLVVLNFVFILDLTCPRIFN